MSQLPAVLAESFYVRRPAAPVSFAWFESASLTYGSPLFYKLSFHQTVSVKAADGTHRRDIAVVGNTFRTNHVGA